MKRIGDTFSGVLYQGRGVRSTVFDAKFVDPEGNAQDGPGFYLTSSKQGARAYMGPPEPTLLEVEVTEARLVPHKPHGTQERAKARKLLRSAPHLSMVLEDWDPDPTRAFEVMAAALERANETTWGLFQGVWYDGFHRVGDDSSFVRGMVDLGYDAALSPGPWVKRLHLIAYNPAVLTATIVG